MMTSLAHAATPNKVRWVAGGLIKLAPPSAAIRGRPPTIPTTTAARRTSSIADDGRTGTRHPPRRIRLRAGVRGEPARRRFSSASDGNARIFRYGGGRSGGDGGATLPPRATVRLTPRRSAELEDELYARLDDANNDDDRLRDPILGKFLSRRGLGWIRSVSVPSSSSLDDMEMEGSMSMLSMRDILVTIEPPTLLHPMLSNIASNVARFVQEEMASLIGSRSERFEIDDEQPHLRPEDVGVTVKIISPRGTKPRPSPSASKSILKKDVPNQGSKALRNVTHFLAVYSCKGGVGKSTIATNLAYELSSMGGGGARVGLLDLDVYGPSLPILVRPDDPTVRQTPPDADGEQSNMVEPILHRGVKLMSLGFVSPSSGVPGSGPGGGAAVLRGPMAGRVVSQLLQGTNWGDLDVLVLDLPPGTGDVQLEVCQSLSLSGAVAVSTPSSLAWADVRKGVQMFGEMGVGTLALVENMAYFVCDGGGRHYPFGRSRGEGTAESDVDRPESDADQQESPSLADHFLPRRSHVFHLPVSPTVNESNDSGVPLCCDHPADAAEEEQATFSKLADAISADLLLLQHGRPPSSLRGGDGRANSKAGGDGGDENVSTVTVDEAGDSEFDLPFTQLTVDNEGERLTVRLFSGEGGYQKAIAGGELRSRDPRTGEEGGGDPDAAPAKAAGGCGSPMLRHHSAGDDDSDDASGEARLFPATVTKKGNYGYEVEWADGASIIYSLLAIAKSAGGKPRDSK